MNGHHARGEENMSMKRWIPQPAGSRKVVWKMRRDHVICVICVIIFSTSFDLMLLPGFAAAEHPNYISCNYEQLSTIFSGISSRR